MSTYFSLFDFTSRHMPLVFLIIESTYSDKTVLGHGSILQYGVLKMW